MVAAIESYKDLIVWQKARQLSKGLYEITASFPPHELYGMTSQIRRAAISIIANLAEGSVRSTRKDFCHFVVIAYGSATELEALLLLACDLNHLKPDAHAKLAADLKEILKMLNALRASLKD
ncbi:MAG TPA: four helix bundle protein [Alphaproteobacteria bacterium]|nr:four helix bundle protein [Alphaproteobacteria bacterium]